MYSIKELQEDFKQRLEEFPFSNQPETLYRPVNYIMNLGGKRIRPVLLSAAYNLFNDKLGYPFKAALAFEVFHNFSLLHDDIMDDADLRRGKPTVHVEYDTNTAILSGDVMLIYSYKLFEDYNEELHAIMSLFTQTAIEVCEGQRMDMDFEQLEEVSIADYLKMIELKTSVLIAAALKTGGILGGASETDTNHLYEFGKNMGIAFQIQDDILDTFGTEELLGKKIGGDIKQKKKTYLYLKALELLSKDEAQKLRDLFINDRAMEEKDITEAKDLLVRSHVKVHAEELKLVYQQLALSHLAAVDVPQEKKQILFGLANNLLNRSA